MDEIGYVIGIIGSQTNIDKGPRTSIPRIPLSAKTIICGRSSFVRAQRSKIYVEGEGYQKSYIQNGPYGLPFLCFNTNYLQI